MKAPVKILLLIVSGFLTGALIAGPQVFDGDIIPSPAEKQMAQEKALPPNTVYLDGSNPCPPFSHLHAKVENTEGMHQLQLDGQCHYNDTDQPITEVRAVSASVI